MTDRELNIARKINNRIKKKDSSASVILFGSHAKGKANSESDWDILILIDAQKTDRSVEMKYRDELFDLELELGEPISTLIYSKSDWYQKHFQTPLFESIENEGIKLS
jgi:predicted nucleotidyltransferase